MAGDAAAQSSGTITPDFSTASKSSRPSSSRTSSSTSLRSSPNAIVEDASPPDQPTLPPADTGSGAYLFLFGLWLNFFTLGGLMLNFGIFQAYYARHLFPAPSDSRRIAIIGTLGFGFSNFLNPLFTQLALRFPTRRRTFAFAGYVGAIFALLAASFATELWQLMLTQGVLLGSCWVCMAAPLFTILNEWFERKRGRAYGVVFGGGGTGVVVLPLILETLLQRFEFRWTLRIYAVIVAVVCGVGLALARERRQRPLQQLLKTAASRREEKRRRMRRQNDGNGDDQARYAVGWAFLRHPIYWVFAAAVIMHALAFQLPLIFLPSFAQALGYSRERSALVLTAYGVSQVFGQFTIGSVSDRVSIHLLAGLCPLVSGAAALALWGPAKGYAPLVAYAMLQGLFGPGFNILYSRMASSITDDAGLAAMIFSMFAFQRGFGNMLAGPVASRLLRDEVTVGEWGLGRFAGVITMVGCAMLACSANGASWFWRGYASRHRIPVQTVGPKTRAVRETEGLLAGGSDEEDGEGNVHRDYGSNRG